MLFALDSIPAIYGLTTEPYIVFTANAFALMGQRQLFNLLDGLLDKLVYLSWGLSIILGFIGSSSCCTPCTRTPCRSSTVGEHISVPEISSRTVVEHHHRRAGGHHRRQLDQVQER